MREIVPCSGVFMMDCAAFLILDRGEVDLEVLLVEKQEQPGVWGLPGGQSQPGESPLLTMWRETIEEIGVTVEDPAVILETTIDGPSPHVFVVFGKYVGSFDMKRLRLGPEIKRAAFFRARELQGLIAAGLVRPRHVHAIQEYERTRCP